MDIRLSRRFPAWLILILAPAAVSAAAEIQVRARCVPRGPIITLGDVAELSAADAQEAEKLASRELFPAPAAGQQRTVRLRELQDLISDRGISLAGHRLSGSSQVVIAVPAVPAEQDRTVDRHPLSPAAVKRAERAVTEAIVQYLQEQASSGGEWRAAVKLTSAQARAIPADGRKITVRGGQPSTGTRQFELAIDDGPQPVSFVVNAEVSQPMPVVVTTKAIGRGDAIRPTDVRLQPQPAGADKTEPFRALEDVAGAQAVQEIPAGTVLQRSLVCAPLLVRRGEMVTVYSRAAGIRIRLTARAREDGSLGDLVNVESLLDRKTYSARVCGVQEAEVYARAMQAAPAPTDGVTPRLGAASAKARQHKANSYQAASPPEAGRATSRRVNALPATPELAQNEGRNPE
jgi:flagella basal body P-ring formation protein FlgA